MTRVVLRGFSQGEKGQWFARSPAVEELMRALVLVGEGEQCLFVGS